MTYEELIEASKLDDPLIIDGQVYEITDGGLYIHGIEDSGEYGDDLLITIVAGGYKVASRDPKRWIWTHYDKVFPSLESLVDFIYTL